ncbi:MAG: hypothetical protein AB8F95_18590 [Bacteroidia bacterium]
MEDTRRKFERIEPLLKNLQEGISPSAEAIFTYSADISTREMTCQLLLEYDKLELFPKEFYSIEKLAESNLANWLEFPTELGAIPDEIAHLEKVVIDMEGNNVIFHVFKFRMHEPHPEANEGWSLGVVGPYFNDSEPHHFPAATFSRLGSKFGEISPKDEVRWVHENIALKRLR